MALQPDSALDHGLVAAVVQLDDGPLGQAQLLLSLCSDETGVWAHCAMSPGAALVLAQQITTAAQACESGGPND